MRIGGGGSNSLIHSQAIPEIKNILTTWRERLPNEWEDVGVWTDILTWRQHVFTLINGAFQPLLEVNSSVAYIGHHEAAWTINRCTPAPLPPSCRRLA